MSGQRAKLPPEVMAAAQRAIESGVPIVDTASHLGVSVELLKKRAQRGGWLTRRKIERATESRITAQATEVVAKSRAERG